MLDVRWWWLLCVMAAMVAGCAREGRAEACGRAHFDGSDFLVCRAEPGMDAIALVLEDPRGARLRSLRALAALEPPKAIRFAMNAGMYDADGGPIGLFVVDGETQKPINRRPGPGNFHMLPNGVFWGDSEGRWGVSTSDTFAATGADFATQSGPMLLIDGALHPDISDDGPSRNIRNAVGVDARGAAVFVISQEPVSFGKLARFFRDGLGCSNALYLDGGVSSLWAPTLGRLDSRADLGPLVVVRDRQAAQ